MNGNGSSGTTTVQGRESPQPKWKFRNPSTIIGFNILKNNIHYSRDRDNIIGTRILMDLTVGDESSRAVFIKVNLSCSNRLINETRMFSFESVYLQLIVDQRSNAITPGHRSVAIIVNRRACTKFLNP